MESLEIGQSAAAAQTQVIEQTPASPRSSPAAVRTHHRASKYSLALRPASKDALETLRPLVATYEVTEGGAVISSGPFDAADCKELMCYPHNDFPDKAVRVTQQQAQNWSACDPPLSPVLSAQFVSPSSAMSRTMSSMSLDVSFNDVDLDLDHNSASPCRTHLNPKDVEIKGRLTSDSRVVLANGFAGKVFAIKATVPDPCNIRNIVAEGRVARKMAACSGKTSPFVAAIHEHAYGSLPWYRGGCDVIYTVMDPVDTTFHKLLGANGKLAHHESMLALHDMCAAADYYHKDIGCVYNDYNPGNVGVTRDGVIKIIDNDCCAPIHGGLVYEDSGAGWKHRKAPERQRVGAAPYSAAADTFGIAVQVLQVAVGFDTFESLIKKVERRSKHQGLWTRLDMRQVLHLCGKLIRPQLYKALRPLLTPNPSERATPSEVLESGLFDKLNFKKARRAMARHVVGRLSDNDSRPTVHSRPELRSISGATKKPRGADPPRRISLPVSAVERKRPSQRYVIQQPWK